MCGKLACIMREKIRNKVHESAWGLSDEREVGILFIAGKHKISQIEIAHLLEVDKNTIRGFIDNLERLGLVVRQKNPNNREENLILLTDKGKSIVLEMFDAIVKYERVFLPMFSEEELETLGALLRKFFYSLDDRDSFTSYKKLLPA